MDHSSGGHKSGVDSTEERVGLPSVGKVESPSRNRSEVMDTGQEIDGDGIPVGEEAWEEYGCILWDLAASRNHAELMVPIFRTCLFN